MSDTTTITPEERALWRKRFDSPFFDKGCKPFSLRTLDALEDSERRVSELTSLLDASCEETRQSFSALYKTATEVIPALNAKIEQAEVRAEKAESDKAALEEDLEATEKNLKESSGFIEELLSGLKHRFPVQYADLEGDEYGDDAFSAHDLFEHVIDPAVDAAKEQAEAENARLNKELDWLAERCADELGFSDSLFKERKATMNEWKEAARRAVAAGEEPCQK